MNSIKYMQGVKPQLRDYLALQEKAMNGDIVMVIDPTTAGTTATSEAFTRSVDISIETAAGEVHTWVNSSFATTLAIAESTVGSGAATIVSTTLTLVEGKATVVISATGVWAADDTNTLTVSNIILGGVTVTAGTSVDTIVAA